MIESPPPRAMRYEVAVCRGPTCAGERGADAVFDACRDGVRERRLERAVAMTRRKCFGMCRRGPNVYVRALGPLDPADATSDVGVRTLRPRSALYHGVRVVDVAQILDDHVCAGTRVDRLLTPPDDDGDNPDATPQASTPAERRADEVAWQNRREVRLAMIARADALPGTNVTGDDTNRGASPGALSETSIHESENG